MRKLGLAVAAMLFGWSPGALATPVQWTAASGGNDHWYDFMGRGLNGDPTSYTWDTARVDAELRGGYLSTITSAAEWSFLRSNLADWVGPVDPHYSNCAACGYRSYQGWLGGFQNANSPNYSEPGGGWEWITGETWSFTAWHSGEPNQHGNEYQLMTWFHDASGWADHVASGSTRYFIEYDTYPIPEPSTALLLGLGLVGMAARRRVTPLLAGALVLGMLGGPVAQAVAFQEGFEGDLSAWTSGGSRGLPHSGLIVSDPFDPSNHVLTFSTTTWGGDILTVGSFGHPAGTSLRLSWDSLGVCGHSDCGGFVGIWEDSPAQPGYPPLVYGNHDWLVGSCDACPGPVRLVTPDTGSWQHVSVDFVLGPGQSVYLMFEDAFYSAGAAPSDAYFDNIQLQVIPEPSTALLLGLGLAGMAARRRV